jgi:hypothetical protein
MPLDPLVDLKCQGGRVLGDEYSTTAKRKVWKPRPKQGLILNHSEGQRNQFQQNQREIVAPTLHTQSLSIMRRVNSLKGALSTTTFCLEARSSIISEA